MRAALYARVSHVGQNPEMQLAELRQYCARRGWEIAGEYVDVGVSGAKERRPQLDRLLVDCRKRSVDAVVVYRYDRFARSLRQLVNALCEFEALGIQFVSLHEGVYPKRAPRVRHLRQHRGVRAGANPRARSVRLGGSPGQGQTSREATRPCRRLQNCRASQTGLGLEKNRNRTRSWGRNGDEGYQ